MRTIIAAVALCLFIATLICRDWYADNLYKRRLEIRQVEDHRTAHARLIGLIAIVGIVGSALALVSTVFL